MLRLPLPVTCGAAAAADLVIGMSSWSSASATSHILQHILEESFGIDVELKRGTNEEIFAGMDDGTIHIHYSTKLAEERPDISAFLRVVELDIDTVSQMTYALVVERRDPGEFAAEWVSENRDRVTAWREAAR